jgi:hypothetical protein
MIVYALNTENDRNYLSYEVIELLTILLVMDD